MRSVPSKAFRRQCLALALVALTWALPNETYGEPSYGEAYPLEDVRHITDTLKPNVLIVLESAESMQGLPGENPARYNTIGADCEDGNRNCRLVGQRGRWAFSGMGSKGMYFGTAPTSCTNTYTDTITGVQTFSNTQTWINPTATVTNSDTITKLETVTDTSTAYGTDTSTEYGTDTETAYGTETFPQTTTGTHVDTTTQTEVVTVPGTYPQTTTATTTTTTTGTTTALATSTFTQGGIGASINWTGTYTGTLVITYLTWTSTNSLVSTGTATLNVNGTWLPASQTATVTLTSPSSNETSTATGTYYLAGAQLTGVQTFTGTRTAVGYNGPNYTIPGSATKALTATSSFNGWLAGIPVMTWHNTTTVQGTGTTYVTVSAQNTATAYVTTTAQDTISASNTITVSNTLTNSNTVTNSSTALGTGTLSEYGTVTFTSTGNAIDTETFEDTQVYTATGTQTSGACAFPGAPDPGDCISAGSESTSRGYCNWSTYAVSATGTSTSTNPTSYVPCSSEEACSGRTKGDFCRYISELDYSGREKGEVCIGASTNTATNTATSTAWGSCKRGRGTQNTSCGWMSGGSDDCTSALQGDFCAEGKPAKMCSESGIWCASTSDCLTHRCTNNRELCINDEDCPIGGYCVYEATPPESCVAATSRMMAAKRALRRAVTDYADKVKFGFMTTYQGRGIPATGTDSSTKIFPYVKVVAGSEQSTKETRLLTRGELEKGVHTSSGQSCFDPVNGPRTPCKIDYGASGAINPSSLPQNEVTYYKVTVGDDSLYGIRRNDGSSKYDHRTAVWSSSCKVFCPFSGSTGVYEGSFYYQVYSQGTPILSGAGSMANPDYFDTYRGKSFWDGGTLYNAIDAERSDFINDGIYGRHAYTPVNLSSPSPYSVITKSIVTVSGTATGTSVATTLMPDVNKEATVAPPWAGASEGQYCTTGSGAIWNHQVVPRLNATNFAGPGIATPKNITPSQKALMIAARLDKASFGGVAAVGNVAPIGCALNNEASSQSYYGAAAYMEEVRSTDGLANASPTAPGVARTPCWSNGIVLVVDGVSDGPGDMGVSADCASAACASSDPVANNCQCGAITKAYSLAHPAAGIPPVQTHVVVNAPARWSARYPYTYAFLWNLAVAGSPHSDGMPAFGASEDELYQAISQKIALAAYRLPSYTTTEPVPGANTQDPSSKLVTTSTYLYTAASSYPSWKGTVRAYDTSSGIQLLWDAASVAAYGHPESWTKRRIYFGNTSGGIVQVGIDPTSGAITNRDALYSAGLGASAAEAEKIMQWLLGKPELGNRSPLMGPVSSSTPIVVGQAPDNGLVGAEQYSANTWQRPRLLYVGSDDGMLHAFFAHAGSLTLGSETYQGGEEAFAFIPNDMLGVIRKLYAQGGQPLAPDKRQHIFGLAGSPKVKDMCIGAGCATDTTGSGWHTVLVMTEGPGGNKPFALDVTNVVTASQLNGLSSSSLLWGAAFVGDNAAWNAKLGETMSVPAFYLHSDVGGDENRVVFASGYPTDPAQTGQGFFIVDANAATGAIADSRDVRLATAVASGFGGSFLDCSVSHPQQRRTVMADVALARDYSAPETTQHVKAAYTGDTWGNLFQYVPSASGVGRLYSLGCGHPIHFTPTVVQLDRLPRSDPTSKGKIYLAQVTNSNMDPLTRPYSSTYPGSQLVVTRLDGAFSPPLPDDTFNSTGQIALEVCPDGSTAANCICVQTTTSGDLNDFNGGSKTAAQGCQAAGGENLPKGARPVGTPMAVLRSDGLGFQVITGWYDASNDPTGIVNVCADADPSSFDKGTSYLTVHEFRSNGAYYQIVGQTIENAVVTGGTFVGTGLFVDGIGVSPELTPQAISLGEQFSTNQQMLAANAIERYTRTTWSERME